MKYYLIAGEASGDIHGANLMKALKHKDAQAEFRFWGGNKMQQVGGTQVEHYKNTAFMGFWEVLTHLRTILRFIKLCNQDILEWQPDVLILIDYPGFNLRIAEFAKQKGFIRLTCQCPVGAVSKRRDVKELLKELTKLFPNTKTNLFHALKEYGSNKSLKN